MAKAKRNIFLKAAGLMLGATMLATCAFSGTMAQYKSTGTAEGVEATVGKWDIQVDSQPIDSFTIDLDSGMTIVNSGAQADEAAYQGTTPTQSPVPGTYGYKKVDITNSGVVDAIVKISSNNNFEGNTSTGITVGILESEPNGQPIESIDLAEGILLPSTETKSLYFAYNWVFEGNDTEDTALGTAEGSITFGDITVEATQAKYQAPEM